MSVLNFRNERKNSDLKLFTHKNPRHLHFNCWAQHLLHIFRNSAIPPNDALSINYSVTHNRTLDALEE
ncbi:unnamed protein product [Tenebrio molitor]|nr:unnamed protein product [Tenebrio molitor]